MTTFALYSLASVPLLWVFFLAVMKLKDVRDAGALAGPAKWLGYCVLAVGYALDVFAQLVVFTALYREWPPRREVFPYFEPTVSDRTRRWARAEGDSFNHRCARWLRRVMLAPFDASGGHS